MYEGVFSTSLKNERVLRPCLKSPYFTRATCVETLIKVTASANLVLYTGFNAQSGSHGSGCRVRHVTIRRLTPKIGMSCARSVISSPALKAE